MIGNSFILADIRRDLKRNKSYWAGKVIEFEKRGRITVEELVANFPVTKRLISWSDCPI